MLNKSWYCVGFSARQFRTKFQRESLGYDINLCYYMASQRRKFSLILLSLSFSALSKFLLRMFFIFCVFAVKNALLSLTGAFQASILHFLAEILSVKFCSLHSVANLQSKFENLHIVCMFASARFSYCMYICFFAHIYEPCCNSSTTVSASYSIFHSNIQTGRSKIIHFLLC